jgi:hypothetical protein
MDKRILASLMLISVALLPCGCNKGSEPVKTSSTEPAVERKPLEAISGQSAFNQMYRPVRQWAADAVPLTLTCGENPQVKNEGGKAAMWTGVFASPSRREARTAFYSATDDNGIARGVSVAGTQPWGGANTKSKPFNAAVLFVDSDQAYKTALEKAEPWVKKHPDKKFGIYLASASKNADPVWVVMWGDMKNGYVAYVNGTSGKMMNGR